MKRILITAALLMLFFGPAEANDYPLFVEYLCKDNSCKEQQYQAGLRIMTQYGNYIDELNTLPLPLWSKTHHTIAKCISNNRENLPEGLIPNYVKIEECIIDND